MRNSLAAMFMATTAIIASPLSAAIPDNGGPYDARFMAGGVGIGRDIATPSLRAGSPFSISGWVRVRDAQAGVVTLMSVGDAKAQCRCMVIDNGTLALRSGDVMIRSSVKLALGKWTHIAVVSDGFTATIYINGKAAGSGKAPSVDVVGKIGIAPVVAGQSHFGGELVGFAYHDMALSAANVRAAYDRAPAFDVVHIWDVGKGWEWQNKANTGLWRPQDPWTLPSSTVPPTAPVAKPVSARPVLETIALGRMQINGWELAEVPKVEASGDLVSRSGFGTSGVEAARCRGNHVVCR